MQAQKLISFGKVKNLVEGLEIQTRFEKIKLLLSTMVKLPSSFFCNDGIRITSTLLRQNIVKRKKMKKWWQLILRGSVEIQYQLGFRLIEFRVCRSFNIS